jgi:peroxiredoxin Q/BCP
MKSIFMLGMLGIFGGSEKAWALKPGDAAPAVVSHDQDGREVKLADLKGKWVLLYFYPKDDTPGCTKQACSLRDGFAQYKKAGVVVYGISTQDAESHRKFREKYHLPFDLLVDEKGELGKAFDIDKMPIIGMYKRQSVLINPEGKIATKLDDVDPATHSDDILKVVNGAGKH